MTDQVRGSIGREVFFLYPHSVIQGEMIEEIIGNEYDVYLLNDHAKALRLLRRHNNAILFINIDVALPEEDWEKYVRIIMSSQATIGVGVGILTYKEDRELARKYLMDLTVSCGYMKLSLGRKETTETLLKTLEANGAKGRRKYTRAQAGDRSQASFSARIAHDLRRGAVHDISSAGMACAFDQAVNLELREILQDIRLKLKASLCLVSGLVAGLRHNGSAEYVLMFSPNMSPDARSKISSFVFDVRQEAMRKELAWLT